MFVYTGLETIKLNLMGSDFSTYTRPNNYEFPFIYEMKMKLVSKIR